VGLENSTLFVEDKVAVQGCETVVRSLRQTSLDEEESKALIAVLGEELSVEDSAPRVAHDVNERPGAADLGHCGGARATPRNAAPS
jgi:hypothetical protein